MNAIFELSQTICFKIIKSFFKKVDNFEKYAKNKYLVSNSCSNNLNTDFEQGFRSHKNPRSPSSMEAAILDWHLTFWPPDLTGWHMVLFLFCLSWFVNTIFRFNKIVICFKMLPSYCILYLSNFLLILMKIN